MCCCRTARAEPQLPPDTRQRPPGSARDEAPDGVRRRVRTTLTPPGGTVLLGPLTRPVSGPGIGAARPCGGKCADRDDSATRQVITDLPRGSGIVFPDPRQGVLWQPPNAQAPAIGTPAFRACCACIAAPPKRTFRGNSGGNRQRLSLRRRRVCNGGRRARFRGHPARGGGQPRQPPPWRRLAAAHDRGGRSRCRRALHFERRFVTVKLAGMLRSAGSKIPASSPTGGRRALSSPPRRIRGTRGPRSLGAAGE